MQRQVRRAISVFALLGSLLVPGISLAKPPIPAPTPAVNRTLEAGKDLVKHTVIDTVGIAISPLKWRAKEWLTFGAVVGTATLFVLYADEPIRESVKETDGFQDFGENIKPLGRAPGIAAVTGGFLLSGILLDRAKDRETVALLVESITVGYLFESSIKHATGRERPKDAKFGSRDFTFFGGGKSMPSGEVTVAFVMAGVVASQYESLWVKVAAYSLATTVGLGRIAADGHWTSDVLIGAAIGTFVARSVVHRHRKRKQAKADQPKWNLALTPTGVLYSYIW